MDDVFSPLARKYDLWYDAPFGASAYKLELECLSELIPKKGLGLEVGVGTGRFASTLGVKYGIDPSFEMLKMAKDRGIKCVLGVGEELPFRDGSFDYLLMVVSVCFVQNPTKVFEEAFRVLREGGTLIIGLIFAESKWAEFYRERARQGHPIYKHAKFYTYGEIKSLLELSGFSLIMVRSTLLEEPQDAKPIANKEIKDLYIKDAGFACVVSKKI